MSVSERGIYITLLCLCWLEQQLPVDAERLAKMVKLPRGVFAKRWPAVAICFTEVDGRLIHKRLDVERRKQETYRTLQSKKGQIGAGKRWRNDSRGHRPVLAQAIPNDGSPICVLHTTYSSDPSDPQRPPPSSRSKRPIFKGQRVTVFEWMLDDCLKTLGPYADAFDLHAWFFELDAHAQQTEVVIPQRDSGAWLQQQLLAEATRRGLPIASSLGKFSTRMARALAAIEAETRAESATQGPSAALGRAKGRE